MSGAVATLTLDDKYDLLSNKHRRAVVDALLQYGSEADRDDVIDYVADTLPQPADVSDTNHRKHVYIALHQNHLPRLDDAGVVEYDYARSVERGAHFDTLARMKARNESEGQRGEA